MITKPEAIAVQLIEQSTVKLLQMYLKESLERVCGPYFESDAPGMN
jgi:hypothetical protein